jgi:hypothetical protein
MSKAITKTYRARWEIDIFEATDPIDAARKAETIMRSPIDGTFDQARVIDVKADGEQQWAEIDLALLSAGQPPPPLLMQRLKDALGWTTFQQIFKPTRVSDEGWLVDPENLPKDRDPTYWWTAVDYEPHRRHLFLVPGITRANRLGHIQCKVPWGGKPDDHPLYFYR